MGKYFYSAWDSTKNSLPIQYFYLLEIEMRKGFWSHIIYQIIKWLVITGVIYLGADLLHDYLPLSTILTLAGCLLLDIAVIVYLAPFLRKPKQPSNSCRSTKSRIIDALLIMFVGQIPFIGIVQNKLSGNASQIAALAGGIIFLIGVIILYFALSDNKEGPS